MKKMICLTLIFMLIFSASVSAAPYLKYSNGGTFGLWSEESYYCTPVCTDINADGKNEIICASYGVYVLDAASGELIWRVNAGKDRSTPFVEIGGNSGHTWCDISVCDIDGDSVSEIISGHSDGTVSVLSSDGYFKWGWPQKVVSAPVRSLKIADLDSDGRSEIIAGFGTESPENVWVFEPDGSVRPGWPQMDAGHRAQDGGDYRENGWAWGVFNDNISTGDIDGDGQLEIIVPSDLAFTAAYNPDGTQVKANETYYGGRTWAKIPFYEDYGTEIRMDNEGWGFPLDGTEKREDLFRAEMGHAGSCVYDLDGDGKNEVALVGIMANRKYSFYPPTEYMTLFILNGDRTRFYNAEKGYDWRRIPTDLGAPLVQTPEIISSRVNSKPVVEDLNGDGVPEILFPSYNGKLHCFSLDRSEKGAWPYSLTKRTSPLFEYASAPACADINGDGKKEVVFVSFYDPSQSVPQGSGGSLYILDCEGRLISKTQLPPSKEAGNYINGSMATPLIYDTDGDGVLEIVINTLHGGISVFGL